MDHVEIPPGVPAEYVKFHYLGSQLPGLPKYDYKGVAGFLERNDTDEASLKRDLANLLDQKRTMDLQEYEEKLVRHLSLIQEWCWFGLMDALACEFEIPIPRSLLTRSEEDGSEYLSTSFLHSYVQAAIQKRAERDGLDANDLIKRSYGNNARDDLPYHDENEFAFGKTVSIVRRVVIWLDLLYINRTITRQPYTEVVLSVRFLVEAFSVIAMVGLRTVPVMGSDLIAIPTISTERGRCEYRIAWSGTSTTDYLMSLLPSYDNRIHSMCTTDGCVHAPKAANDIKPTHLTPDCSCHMFEISIQLLGDMIKNGRTPGIQMERSSSTSKVEFKVVDVNNQHFIAISHVWNHGLGNPERNALPTCQVSRLFDLISKISDSKTCLWIDSLSVPCRSESKQIAIQGLRHIYRQAQKVLILDNALQRVGNSPRERLLQVLSSEWASRLWTLQEGFLARQAYIQFREEAVPVSLLTGDKLRRYPDALSYLWRPAEYNVYRMFNMEIDQDVRFSFLIKALSRRHVTVKEDEPICLATLLGLRIEDYSSGVKMVDIYRSMLGAQIYANAMFIGGPRLSEPGFRWAPASLLSHGDIHNYSQLAAVSRTKGLQLRGDLSVFIDSLPSAQRRADGQIVISVHDDVSESDSVHTSIIVYSEPEVLERAWETRSKCDGAYQAVMIYGEPGEKHGGIPYFGVLVHPEYVFKDDSGQEGMHCRFLCVVISRVVDPGKAGTREPDPWGEPRVKVNGHLEYDRLFRID